MPIDFPPSPEVSDTYSYGGKNFIRLDGYWSAVSTYAQPSSGSQYFMPGVAQKYYETFVDAGVTPLSIATVTMLQHT